jgi:hypothetical protein
MARHFGHQRYKPVRSRFRISTGEQPHSRHGVATRVGSAMGKLRRPARPGGGAEQVAHAFTHPPRRHSSGRTHCVAKQFAAAAGIRRSSGRSSLGALSCGSVTSAGGLAPHALCIFRGE